MRPQPGGIRTVQADLSAVAGFVPTAAAGCQCQGQAGCQQGVLPRGQRPRGSCLCGLSRDVGRGRGWWEEGGASWQWTSVDGSQRFCGHRFVVVNGYGVPVIDIVTYLSPYVTNSLECLSLRRGFGIVRRPAMFCRRRNGADVGQGPAFIDHFRRSFQERCARRRIAFATWCCSR